MSFLWFMDEHGGENAWKKRMFLFVCLFFIWVKGRDGDMR